MGVLLKYLPKEGAVVDTLHGGPLSGSAFPAAQSTQKDDQRERWNGPETLPFPSDAPVAYFSSSAKFDPIQGPKILALAQTLHRMGWALTGTDGTAEWLTAQGVPAYGTSALYSFAKVLGGRVSSLLPQIWGGVLAAPEMRGELETLHWLRPRLVYGDFYAFDAAVADPTLTDRKKIDKIDVGGPSFIHATVKGFCDPNDEGRLVIVDPDDCEAAINLVMLLSVVHFDGHHELTRDFRVKAERKVAEYLLQVAIWQGRREGTLLPDTYGIIGQRRIDLAYAENRHQGNQPGEAAYYATDDNDPLAMHKFVQMEGGAPGWINITDMNGAVCVANRVAAVWQLNFGYVPFIAVVVKHDNPCGVAVGSDARTTLENAVAGDPLAAKGCGILINWEFDNIEATTMRHHGSPGVARTIDVVMAPSITSDARNMLRRKNDRCRMFQNSALADPVELARMREKLLVQPIRGGFLVQRSPTHVPRIPLIEPPDGPRIRQDMALGWAVGSASASNSMILVKNGSVIGTGTGQKDRVGALMLAKFYAERAGHETTGSVLYGDSFNPFRDVPDAAAAMGVVAAFCTSGSINDASVEAAFAEHGILLHWIPDAEGREFRKHGFAA